MRRKDRERSEEEGLAIIDNAPYGTVSMVLEDGSPYAVPLSPARVDKSLYIHAAKLGKKLEGLFDGSKVKVVFVSSVEVPNLLGSKAIGYPSPDDEEAAAVTSNLFTTTFASAIVEGTVRAVHDDDEKIFALRTISEKYTPHMMPYFELAMRRSLAITAVFCIEIDTLTAKCKEYDADGVEIRNKQ